MTARADSRYRRAADAVRAEDYVTAWLTTSDLLNENPDDPEALYLCGHIMREQHHVGMALNMFRRALALEQKKRNLWMGYAACLHDTNQYEAARDAFLIVAKNTPRDPAPVANVAATYVQQGRCREAVEWADKALALIDARYAELKGDEPNADELRGALENDRRITHIAKGYACLGLGRWEEGWKYVEALYGETLRIRVYNPPEREEPMWDGSPGKTVVVQADQGLGDVIMFAQCLPDMVRNCRKVIVETSPRLAALFRRNFPGIIVYETLKQQNKVRIGADHQIDAHIHLSLLGKFYRKRTEDFPRVAYLTAEPALAAKWHAWLEQFPRPWVGLAWRGGIATTNVRARSIFLREYEPILRVGGSFISMAYQDVADEVAYWNKKGIADVHLPGIDNDGDYDETLALASQLDHIITVQTTLAHVCGALGRSAYVLVNNVPQWRYAYRAGDGMIWYPENSVSLYRQAPGEKTWEHAIARVARDYETFIYPRLKAA